MQKVFQQINNEMKANLLKLVDNKNWNIYRGEFVNKVEKKIEQLIGAPALTTNSGSSSLEMCLRALGITTGDQVIIPSFTFVATAQAILALGGVPVLAQTDDRTFNLNAANIQKCLTPKTKAVIFVHLFGNPSNILEVQKFCQRKNLFLVEDCAQGFGAKLGQRSAGTFGHCSAFSFNSCKHISSGEGGLVVSKNRHVFKKLEAIRHAGLVKRGQQFVSAYIGGKNLMTEFQAAAILPQLNKWPILFKNRLEIARKFLTILKESKIFTLQQIEPRAIHSFQRIVFLAQDYQTAQKILANNHYLERIYPLPLIKEPIIMQQAKFSQETKRKALDFWNRHLGFTFLPFTDYSQFINNLKIKL
jgi:perosamine synthetase